MKAKLLTNAFALLMAVTVNLPHANAGFGSLLTHLKEVHKDLQDIGTELGVPQATQSVVDSAKKAKLDEKAKKAGKDAARFVIKGLGEALAAGIQKSCQESKS